MTDLDQFDENDPALLEAAVGKVKRIRAEAPPPRPRPAAQARMLQRDESEALRESRSPRSTLQPGDGSEYRRPEVPERVLKRLRRGLYAVQDEIDLHLLRAGEAELLLRRFLLEAKAAEFRCVRIVHGKGLRSRDSEPVLRPLVERLLSQRADVLAFCTAPAAQGGTGAVLVLLARRSAGEGLQAAD